MSRPTPELVRGIPLSGLDDKSIERLAGEFIERGFDEGQAIASEGEGGLNFFVVDDGEATVSVRGNEVGTLGPGASFGEIALVDKSARSATVTAKTRMRCYALPGLELPGRSSPSTPTSPGSCSRCSPSGCEPPKAASARRRRGPGGAPTRVGGLLDDLVLALLLFLLHRCSDAKERPSRARKTRPTPTPTDISTTCRTSPKAKPVRRDAVLAKRQRHRRLEEPDVAGPEREDRRHVHQQQHERRRRQRRVDVERLAWRPRRRAAAAPSRASGRRSPRPPPRARASRRALPRHRDQPPDGAAPSR